MYLPDPPKLEKVTQLCKVIQDYITEKNIPAGTASKFAVKITPHLNLRAPYLESNPDVRIDAVSANEDNGEQVELSHQEIRKDILFQYLSKHFPIGPEQRSMPKA